MGLVPYFLKQNNSVVLRFFFMLLFFCSIPDKANFCSNDSTLVLPSYMSPSKDINSLETLKLHGYLSFHNIDHAAKDFGNTYRALPLAVLYPESVPDISSMIKCIFEMGSVSKLTVAARGHGHSLQGQAQAHQGIVINMESLQGPKMHVHTGGQQPYVDVSGGELWINVLHETLKYGFAPKTWTDYLHLTIGGTLSNAGISGQTFKHGPQIDNVYQMEVVTGKGEVVTCSMEQNTDLFYGVLGGLGQFGIITRARISLEPAPKKVKWIRVLYSDFSKFTNDQEQLISSENSFDYIEGFVIINRTGLVKKWRSSFDPKYPLQASQFVSEGKTLYCLELAKYFDPDDSDNMNQKTKSLLSELSYTPSTLFMAEVSYVEFLDRVHVSEKKLQEKNLWDIPHPWLNLLVPKTKIFEFSQEVFGKILAGSSNGPIIIYPVNTSKWDKRTSLVTPGEDIVYPVAFLYSAVPSSTGKNGLDYILGQNQRILDFCSSKRLGVKQYLPHYLSQEEWEDHFGSKWLLFKQRKLTYDPSAMLAPGQRIFQRKQSSHDTDYPSHLSLPR